MISILIPTYNYTCAHLVCELQKQCEEVQASVDGFNYEIIVADDCSTDIKTSEENAIISLLPHCRYETQDVNIGRAAIRNWLIKQAQYDWLILMDCDAEVISDDFIYRYWQAIVAPSKEDFPSNDTNQSPYKVPRIIVGGTSTPRTAPRGHELRLKYELAAEGIRTVKARRQHPSLFFGTFNFVCHRTILTQIPFDERCIEYGYEDALFGIKASGNGYSIIHIENPLLHKGINDNITFLKHSEEALRTLNRLGSPMTEHARVARAAAFFKSSKLKRLTLLPLILILYRMSASLIRRNLTSRFPDLNLFAFYKLGYYLSLK